MRTLYTTWLSAPCHKIRMILHEKKLDFKLQVVRPWQKPSPIQHLNPAQTVPILMDVEKKVICGNAPLTEYLEEVYAHVNLLGTTPLQRAETRRLIDWFDQKFNEEVTQAVVFEKLFKRHYGQGNPSPQIIRNGRDRLHAHLEYITWLSERRNWLAGDFFSNADITAVAHLSTLDYLGDVPWDRHPQAKDWYVRVKSRPSFKPLRFEVVPGLKPSPHYQDLDF